MSELSTVAGASCAAVRVRVAARLEADGVDAAVDLAARRGSARSGRVRTRATDVRRSRSRSDRACARRSSLRSPTITTAAPSSCAPTAAARPTGPAPAMYTVEPDPDSGGDGAVEAGREDVGEHREVEDLLQRLVAVGELQQVPVRVRHEHVLGLSAHPAAHVDVAVRAAGPVGVHVQADARLALLAVAAAAARDVERHRDDVADLDELDVRADLDDLAGDLVTEHESLGCGGAAAHHVLVGPADVRRHGPKDHPVGDLPTDIRRIHPGAVLQLELRIFRVDHLHDAGSLIGDRSVARHPRPSFWSIRARSLRAWSFPSSSAIPPRGRSDYPNG